MRTVLGIDAGGSNTRAVLVDEVGQCLAVGRAPGGNPISSGPDAAVASVVEASLAACAGHQQPAALMITMAGGNTIGGRIEGLSAGLAAAGLPAEYAIQSDSLSTYFSATTADDGGAMIAGTGAVGVSVVGGRVTSVVDGAGWLIGDDGSGFWIGRRVVHDVVAALDGRGAATSLTERLLALVPPTAIDVVIEGDDLRMRLIEHAYSLRPVQLARYAPLAFEAAADDAVAARILDDAARHLVALADSLLARVPSGPIVVGGGVAGSTVGDALAAHLGDRALRARDGSVGAAVLGLRHLDVDVTDDVHRRLRESLAPLVA